MLVTPAGKRLFPDFKALIAPASMTIDPAAETVPAIQPFRAVNGSEDGMNHVARPPEAKADSAFITVPSVIAMVQPAAIAILAASSFVNMPPEEYPEGAAQAIALSRSYFRNFAY